MGEIILPEIVPEDFKPYFVEGMSDEAYHADKTAIGSTSIRHLLDSPAKFYYEFNKVKTEEDLEDEEEHFRIGKMVHMAMLEGTKFQERYVVMPEFVGYTKDGKETKSANALDVIRQREEWTAQMKALGKTICSQKDRDNIIGMCQSVYNHKRAKTMLAEGKPELVGYYRDPETGVKCKIKIDFLPFNLNVLLDLKTTKSCRRQDFSKTIWNLRYDIQLAMYCEGVRIIQGVKVKSPAFLAVEKKGPWECAFFAADNTIMEVGMSDYKRGLRIYKECLLKKQWPQRQTDVEEIGLPSWALNGDYE